MSTSSSDRYAGLGAHGRRHFATTHWSMVLAAGGSETTRARDAWANLCQSYWYPLYAFVRRQGYGAHDAQDLTQEFFARLLAREDLAQVRREKGRFRSFLLVALKRFLANEWKRAHRLKRGGGVPPAPLAAADAETRYAAEPVSELTAERVYERRWALTLLERALGRLRAECTGAGRDELYEPLKEVLTGEARAVSYAQAGLALRVTEAAVKMAVHRLRKRYREILREEISHTVANPAEVDEEIRYLFVALG